MKSVKRLHDKREKASTVEGMISSVNTTGTSVFRQQFRPPHFERDRDKSEGIGLLGGAGIFPVHFL